jgi:hypothetical protein
VRRIASVLAAAVVLAAGLTACSTTVNETRNAAVCGPYSSGSSSDAVSASWSKSGPKLDFPTPLSSKRNQVSVLKQGSGATLQDGQIARIGFSLAVGKTGQVLQTGGYGASNFFPRTVGHDDPIGKALECRSVGTRLALVTSVKDLLGTGAGQQLGVSDSSSLVLAIEVISGYPGKADGVNVLQDNSLPAVVTAVDGQPGIVLPNVNKAPTTFRSAVVKAGGGAKLAKGDQVLVQYQSWTWDTTATVNQSSWKAGAPGIATVGDVLTQSDGTQIPFPTRLTGETVGSQLMYVYPAQQGGSTTVWVVDVLGIVK